QALRVDIGGIEERYARLERDIDEARRRLDPGVGPGPYGIVAAAEGRGTEAEHRHFEAGPAEQTVFHVDFPLRIFPNDARPSFSVLEHNEGWARRRYYSTARNAGIGRQRPTSGFCRRLQNVGSSGSGAVDVKLGRPSRADTMPSSFGLPRHW